jgi:hypothetical protein
MASPTQMHNVLCRSVTIEARFTASSRSSGSHRDWTDLYSNVLCRSVTIEARFTASSRSSGSHRDLTDLYRASKSGRGSAVCTGTGFCPRYLVFNKNPAHIVSYDSVLDKRCALSQDFPLLMDSSAEMRLTPDSVFKREASHSIWFLIQRYTRSILFMILSPIAIRRVLSEGINPVLLIENSSRSV